MGFFIRLLVGFSLVGVGIFIVIRTWIFIDFMGPSYWAEQKFGAGGTNIFYKLLGIGVVLLGFVVATNLWNDLLGATLGSLFKR